MYDRKEEMSSTLQSSTRSVASSRDDKDLVGERILESVEAPSDERFEGALDHGPPRTIQIPAAPSEHQQPSRYSHPQPHEPFAQLGWQDGSVVSMMEINRGGPTLVTLEESMLAMSASTAATSSSLSYSSCTLSTLTVPYWSSSSSQDNDGSSFASSSRDQSGIVAPPVVVLGAKEAPRLGDGIYLLPHEHDENNRPRCTRAFKKLLTFRALRCKNSATRAKRRILGEHRPMLAGWSREGGYEPMD